MGKLSRSFLFGCMSVLLAAAAWGAEANRSLVKEWEVSLGPMAESHTFYRSAVCSDGTYYFSDGLGRIVQTDAAGVVVGDVHIEQLRDVLAVTCDEHLHFVGALINQLVTVALDGNRVLSVLRTTPIAPDIGTSMAIARSGGDGYLVLAVKGVSVTAHRINSDGQVLASHPGAVVEPPWSLGNAANGTFVRDPSSNEVLYMPETPYIFMKYSSEKGLVSAIPRNDSAFQLPQRGGASADLRAPGDRVMRAAYLPGGDVLVQVVKRSVVFSNRAQSNVIRATSYLELFDHSLTLKASGIAVQGFGQMQGAAQDGSLYFSNISREGGIHVFKAQLRDN